MITITNKNIGPIIRRMIKILRKPRKEEWWCSHCNKKFDNFNTMLDHFKSK